jgi:AraC-like DNA-binding protein
VVSSKPIDTLLMLGAAQGLFLAILLATKQANSAANKLLAAAMLAFSLFVLEELYYARGYFELYPHLIGASVPLVFTFGPVLYLYAESVSAGGQSLPRRSWLHFLPAVGLGLCLLPFYLQDGANKIEFLHALLRQGPPWELAFIQSFQYPHGLLYVVLTVRLLRRHRERLLHGHSSLERINLLWLRNLTIGTVGVWALATGLHLLELSGQPTEPGLDRWTALAVSLMVYGIGYLGFQQPEIFHPVVAPARFAPEPVAPTATLGAAVGTEPVEGLPSGAASGYGKSGLTPFQADAYAERLLQVIEEKRLYRNSLLTLQDLADEMRISAHNLSEVINTRLGKNFFELVNSYRVEEVKRRLHDPEADHLTILSIAWDAGFNTKSTFNAIFKRLTGLTPSQYRSRRSAPV